MKFNQLLASMALPLVALAAWGCSPTSRTPEGCQTDADCDRLEICEAGDCRAVECKADSDCDPGTTCADGVCMGDGCETDADCPYTEPRCDPDSGACVECLTSDDCIPGADCTDGICKGDGCQSDADCPVAEPRCDVATGLCRECRTASDCEPNEACVDGECQPGGCQSDADCQTPTGHCDLQTGACVECLDAGDCDPDEACVLGACQAQGCQGDGDCQTPTPRCDLPSGDCVECLQPEDCGAGETCVQATCQATGCGSDADCQAPTPRCDEASGDCVECLAPDDCAPDQICSGGVCAAEPTCVTDDQCEIGQICEAGDCVTGCRSQRDCPPEMICLEDLGPHGTCVQCDGDNPCDPGWICQDHVCAPHCTADEHCAPAHCDLPSHQCVECLEDDHCDRDAGFICEAQACVPGCRIDDDCAGGFCDQASAACVDCLTSDHCSLGQICADHQCVVGCESDRDCPGERLCDPDAGPHGGCVECLGDADCDPAYLCVEGLCEFHCNADADCAQPTPACDQASGTCVACTSDANCQVGTLCIGFACLPGCVGNGDCPADQVCDPNLGPHGTCVDCRTGADCPDGFACQANRCVAEGEQTIRIPGGAFIRGSDPGEGDADEEPERTISTPTFYIDRTEVTNEQYRACVQAGGCTEPFEMNAYNDPAKARHPVVFVTWSQAADYCDWKGMELPTEARWERAARAPAPDERTYPWGDPAPTCARANYSGCVGGTDLVGARPTGASAEGVLDLAGNVWEWVADRYVADYYDWSTDQDPTGPGYGDYRVVRGGAYDGLPEHIRAANRASRPPDQASPNVGFRCALVGAPTAAFSVTPEEATYDTTFSVDATGCTDPNHALDALEVRWDWESDGTWDTLWSTGKSNTHRYQAPGYYTITLEVRDPDGNTDSTSRVVAAEGDDGWDGDPCASNADCAGGFVCVGDLFFQEYYCREFCFGDADCHVPGYTCSLTYSPDSALMLACTPP